jgi:hypothetical protein
LDAVIIFAPRLAGPQLVHRELGHTESRSRIMRGLIAIAGLICLLASQLRDATTARILGVGHRLEMLRSDAAMHATQMIDDVLRRDRPDLLLVHRPMNVDLSAGDSDEGVAIVSFAPLPDPARRHEATILDGVVVIRDSDPQPLVAVPSREHSRLAATADAKMFHRVASLLEVARRGWRLVPLAPFYALTTTRKGGSEL